MKNEIVRTTTPANAKCDACEDYGHSTSRSKDCPMQGANINEVIKDYFGHQNEPFTISIRFETFARQQYHTNFRNSIIRQSIFERTLFFSWGCYS
jgi:hypothetical protein